VFFADPKFKIRFEKADGLKWFISNGSNILESIKPTNWQSNEMETNNLWNAMDINWDVSGFTGDKRQLIVNQSECKRKQFHFVGGTWEGKYYPIQNQNFGTFLF